MASDEQRRKWREQAERKRRRAGAKPLVKRTPEQLKAYNREWKRQRRKDAEFRERENAKRRVGEKRSRGTRKSTATLQRVNAPRIPKPKPVRAPAELRAAWRRSHANSQLRRKYPTVEALDRAFRDGEIDAP